MMPWISSSTVGRSAGSTNIFDPPVCQALVETGKVVSIATRPSRSASNSMVRVISLDIEAGGSGSSAFFSISTVPVDMS